MKQAAATSAHPHVNPYSYGSEEFHAYIEAQNYKVQVVQLYRELAARFNRDLAGRYPFGSLSSQDLYRPRVCDFFRTYETDIKRLTKELDSLGVFPYEVGFLRRLEIARMFLAGTGCSRFNEPIRVIFRPKEDATITSNPPRVWKLTDDFGEARAPHGIPTMHWQFGAPIALEVTWSERTGVRPRRASSADDFDTPDSSTIRFAQHGDWALMRFIDARRTSMRSEYSDSSEVVLGFTVPLVSRLEEAQRHAGSGAGSKLVPTRSPESLNFLTVGLKFEHYTASTPRRYLQWPGPFPIRAP